MVSAPRRRARPREPARACGRSSRRTPTPYELGDRRRAVEPRTQRRDLTPKLRVERQLPLDDERRDEDDARAAVGGEPAGEVERMLRLVPSEQRDDDAPVARSTAVRRASAPRPAIGSADGGRGEPSSHELVRDAGEDHVRLEQEEALDVERALVVQQPPPAAA